MEELECGGSRQNGKCDDRRNGNSTVTTYTGSHSLVFSGASSSPANNAPTVANSSGTAIAFGTATGLTFTAGVATVNTTKNGVLKIYKAGAANVSASEGSVTTPTPLALTVSPAAASKYAFAAASATPPAGAADNLTITAQDTYDNTDTTYAGSHSLVFSGASASPKRQRPDREQLERRRSRHRRRDEALQ